MGMASAIKLLNSKSVALKVMTIVNDNAFSKSVLAGVNAEITGASGISVSDAVELSVKGSAPSADDKTKINAGLDKKPDVVIVSGHDGDVQPTIELIGAHAHTPHAVLGTNSLGDYTNGSYKKCVIMPTQWDSTSTAKDPIIGWDSAAFTKAITEAGMSATYHVASAGGAAVGLVNALEAIDTANECTAEAIATKMKTLDITSFYGKLKWNANGVIEKPMYMVQSSTSNYVDESTLAWPLSSSTCWNTDGTGSKETKTDGTGSEASAATTTLFS